MNKKCSNFNSPITKKNWTRKGVQLYKCQVCGHQFRKNNGLSNDVIWQMYQDEKQTISEIAAKFQASDSTIKRHLKTIRREWHQPPLKGSGFVHLDATYWWHNWGILLGLDAATWAYILHLSNMKLQTIIAMQ